MLHVERDPGRQVLDPARQMDLMVVFTGSTRGEFEPCGCGGVFEGGFARRSTVVSRIRATNPNLLLLDTGDTTSSGSASQTEFIFQAYGLFGYDAIALGEGELRTGLEPFDRFARKYRINFVCSNVKFKRPVAVQPFASVVKGPHRIAILSLVSDRWLGMLPMDVRNEISYETPTAALARLVPQLRANHDTVILLSHLGTSARRALGDNLTGVDLWIDTGGHQWAASKLPLKDARNEPPVATSEASFQLDRRTPLFVSWSNDRKIGVAGLQWKGRRWTAPSTNMMELTRGITEDKRFIEIYDAYRYVSRQEILRMINQPVTPMTENRPATLQYVSSEKCRPCHEQIYEFWRTTKHARAFATLRQGNRDADLNCWACHTTGFREPTGFDNPITTPQLIDVGCQDCHQKDLRRHPTQSRTSTQLAGFQRQRENLIEDWHCQRCHVPHRSPNFSGSAYREKIRCSQAIKKTPPSSKTAK